MGRLLELSTGEDDAGTSVNYLQQEQPQVYDFFKFLQKNVGKRIPLSNIQTHVRELLAVIVDQHIQVAIKVAS